MGKTRIHINGAAVFPEPHPQPYSLPDEYGAAPLNAYCCDLAGIKSLAPARLWRRSGRSQKLALAATGRNLKALAESSPAIGEQIEQAAFHLGSALGEPDDTTMYLRNMIEQDEAAPMPAKFINSVPSSLATQVAIANGIKEETLVHSHGVISFELALRQALRHLIEKRGELGIAASAEALSPDTVAIGRERGWYRDGMRRPLFSAPDEETKPKGTIPGEGAASFVLVRKGSNTAGLNLGDVECLGVLITSDEQMASSPDQNYRFEPETEAAWIRTGWKKLQNGPVAWFGSVERAPGELPDGSEDTEAPNLMLAGMNGDFRFDGRYQQIFNELVNEDRVWESTTISAYKHLCGEFCTASALAMELGTKTLNETEDSATYNALQIFSEREEETKPIDTVAIYHYYPVGYRTLIALRRA